jgi:DNA-binding transcriptional ArsR family regulator
MTPEESLAVCAKTRHELRKERGAPVALVKAFSKVESKPVSWLWHERIPLGMLTLYVGNPGVGKSSLSLDLAARLSRGLPFPDGSTCPFGDTLLLAGEDVPEVTIKPRLESMGADVQRIHILLGKRDKNGYDDITLFDKEIIKDAIDQIKADGGDLKLLIIDPLESFLGNIDAYRNTEVRQALRGIISLAEHEQFSVLGIQHLTKKTGIDAIHRIGGSVAFSAAARTIWMFAKDPDDSGGCLFLHSKTNIGRKMPGFHYRITSAENGSGCVAWGGPANNDLDVVLNAAPMARGAPIQDEVLQILEDAGQKGMRTGEIAEILEKKESAVSNILAKLKKAEKVISPQYGLWVLPEVSLSPAFPIGRDGESETIRLVSPELSPVVKVKSETSQKEEELEIF